MLREDHFIQRPFRPIIHATYNQKGMQGRYTNAFVNILDIRVTCKRM